jgi:hypothetical protein
MAFQEAASAFFQQLHASLEEVAALQATSARLQQEDAIARKAVAHEIKAVTHDRGSRPDAAA